MITNVVLFIAAFWLGQRLFRFLFDLQRGYSTYRGTKAPLRYPLVENLPQVLGNLHRSNDLAEIVYSCLPRGTKIFTFKFPFSQRTFNTQDPRNIEHVLKTNFWNYVKGERFYGIVNEVLGDGIFAVDGDKWKEQRKIASQIFTVRNFRDLFVEVFSADIVKVCHVLERAKASGEVIDLYDLLHRYTLDAFMKIGLGVELNSVEVADEASKGFVEAFNRVQVIMAKRLFNPLWKITERFNGTKELMQDDMAVIHSYINQIVAARRAGEEKSRGEHRDLLAMFMEKGFNDIELRDIIVNMVIAGRDTTAQALSWCLFELNQHPEIAAKMKTEISSVLPNRLGDYETLKDLRYCKAVFQESLRLHPSVPKQGKTAVNDDILRDGTQIKAGEMVSYGSYGLGRSKLLWGDDALEFKPERFLDEEVSPFKFNVFNAGPRTCLGMNMAYMEAVVALSAIVPKFSFELLNSDEIEYGQSLTLTMKRGMRVYVR